MGLTRVVGGEWPSRSQGFMGIIYDTIRELGHTLSFQWVPSHIGLEGNNGADALAEEGREQHPNNYEYISKRRQQGGRGMWEELGLLEMSSDEVESMEEGSSGRVSSRYSGTEMDQGQWAQKGRVDRRKDQQGRGSQGVQKAEVRVGRQAQAYRARGGSIEV